MNSVSNKKSFHVTIEKKDAHYYFVKCSCGWEYKSIYTTTALTKAENHVGTHYSDDHVRFIY